MEGEHDVCDDARGARWAYDRGADDVSSAETRSIPDNECYVAVKPGWPGFVAVIMDETDKEGRRWVARAMTNWIKQGWTVERTVRSKAVVGLREYSAARDRRAAEAAKTQVTELPLFASDT
jgi:hypothetical protein